MNTFAKYLSLFGTVAALAACDSSSGTGPDPVTPTDNPFTGKWSYVKYVAFENNGEDTVDYTADKKKDFIVFYDTTGRYLVSTRPTSPQDSIHYKFDSDSLFVTGYVDNFLNYTGWPYVFRGSNRDTLDFSDPMHIELLVRAK